MVYQIYPASFCDSNNDGIGDIPGIISKLDYIKSIGVDVIWLSPHYKSPQIDMGYDIEDFEDVDPHYGTLQDCLNLITEVHKRQMKIIFDLVINHTSDRHKWFQESRSSKSNPKREWYFWKPPRYDEASNRLPPNNWRSQFTVPAWTWDEHTQEYYLHLYASEMPDLNWENEECRQAIYQSSMKFWLDRGIDGFRIDTVNKYSKDITFPDAKITDPNEFTQPAMELYSNGPRMREFLLEMNDVFDKYDIFTVGELPSTPLESDVMKYVSAEWRQLNMIFNFDVVSLGQRIGNRLVSTPFTMGDFRQQLSRWQTFVTGSDAWTTAFLENHDLGRSISRFGSDSSYYRERCGKMLATILATMTGTLFLYQGQEIGMTNAPRTWGVEEYKDIRSVNYYRQIEEKTGGDPEDLKTALDGMQKVARDHARLPMQWDDTENAGFTASNVTPWMRVNDNYKDVNVQAQEKDRESLLHFWRKLLELRKSRKDLFVYGRYELIETGAEDHLFVFRKTCDDGSSITVANMSGHSSSLGGLRQFCPGTLLLGNIPSGRDEDTLLPYEARVYATTAPHESV